MYFDYVNIVVEKNNCQMLQVTVPNWEHSELLISLESEPTGGCTRSMGTGIQTSPGFGLLLVIMDHLLHLLNQKAREHVMDALRQSYKHNQQAMFTKVMSHENKELYDEVKYFSYMNQIFLTKTQFK